MTLNLKDNKISKIYSLAQSAFGQYKKQIVVLTVLGFLGGMLEGIGVNALIPLFSFIMGKGNESNDIITQNIENLFNYFHIAFNVKYLLIFIVVLFVFKAIVLIIFNYIRIIIDTDYEEKTRNKLFASVLRAQWPYLLKQKIGYLQTVLLTDVTRGSMMLRQIGNVIMGVTGLIMYSLVAINISFSITLITLALGGFLFLVFKPLFHKTRECAASTTKANKAVSHYVNQGVLGMKTIKSMHIHKSVAHVGSKFFHELRRLNARFLLLATVSSSLLQPISLIFIVVVFGVAYKMPGFDFAALIAIMYLIQRMFQHIQTLQSNLHSINDAVPYLQDVIDYQKKADEYTEEDKHTRNYEFKDALEFKNVSFSYQQGPKVLNGVDFSVNRGEMVGIIGESGAGKTTIVDLLLRLFSAKDGEILLDNKNINTISMEEWRKNIGYVSQDVFLINDTIANNIRFFDKSLSQKDIEKAAKMANIYEFIKKCSEGFNTIVGERGIMLSAGQRQRVVIARVLARNPKLLILDEATSALDNESEAKIQEVIEKLHHKITVLVVAHRLSTVINADKLVVLEKGKIIEQGSPKNLLANKKSYFYKLTNIRK
tara:strand:+ start:223 stop:2016 length:1794 start_codon:yes stop_codon:yes gene_type:complete